MGSMTRFGNVSKPKQHSKPKEKVVVFATYDDQKEPAPVVEKEPAPAAEVEKEPEPKVEPPAPKTLEEMTKGGQL